MRTISSVIETKKQQQNGVDEVANTKILQAIFVTEVIAVICYFLLSFVYEDMNIYAGIMISSVILVLSSVPLILSRFMHSLNSTILILSIIFPVTYVIVLSERLSVGAVSVWTGLFLFFAISLFYASKKIIMTVSITGIIYTIIIWTYYPNIMVPIGYGEYIIRISIIILTASLCVYVNKRYKKRLNEGFMHLESITILNRQLDESRQKLVQQNKALIDTNEKVEWMAYYDVKTEIPNRNKLIDDFNDIPLLDIDGNMVQMALIYFDFENYKQISLRHGKALAETSSNKIVKDINSTFDTTQGNLYYLNVNEFVFVVNNYERPQEVIDIVIKVTDVFKQTVVTQKHDINIDVNIGISLYPEHGLTLSALLRKATIAIGSIKNKTHYSYQIYNDILMATFERKVVIQEGLRDSISHMYLSFQPIIAIDTGALRGFEALLRWESPEYGFISPSEFIPYAEENMTIIPIGRWVLAEALSVLALINDNLNQSYIISINVSAVQLRHKSFLEDFKEIVKQSGVLPELIELEITENVLIDSIRDILDIFLELRLMGVRIALDDFGTGYSSLAYLHKLPIDIIKIDRTFINDFSKSKENSLVHTILLMAEQLGQEVIAEGVETQEQLMLLAKTTCKYAQGYLISRPIDFRNQQKFFEIVKNITLIDVNK
ncbi:MAG: bifunctional diguanylate cyclase/phosphodiesterase [Vallitaleaceae bacterium]|jgi:EAL domain-containing protein (putative c-di-GMP-specific phosphodiesterase class I)|nr:bifunctional diguanylate cyclase/phosphodiesterase [Vallitaleaceae bacterium]